MSGHQLLILRLELTQRRLQSSQLFTTLRQPRFEASGLVQIPHHHQRGWSPFRIDGCAHGAHQHRAMGPGESFDLALERPLLAP